MWLIYRFNLCTCRFSVDHIDICIVTAVCLCLVDNMYSPLSFWQLEVYIVSIHFVCQINRILMEQTSFCTANCHNSKNLVVCSLFHIDRIADFPISDCRTEHSADVQCLISTTSKYICNSCCDICFFTLWIFLCYQSICISCREMFIIQDPYLHSIFFCFGNDNIHIMPPAFFAKFIMWTCFHANCFNPTLMYFLNLCFQNTLIFTTHPQKRENMIFFYSITHILKPPDF